MLTGYLYSSGIDQRGITVISHGFGGGHNTYKDEFNVEYDQWLETLGYDHTAEENKERYAQDRAEYIHDHLDREMWSDRLDEELLDQLVDFYDRNM